jgi:hypothetical protein
VKAETCAVQNTSVNGIYPITRKAKARARQARYRAKHHEKRNREKRDWAKRNREHVRAYQAAWTAKQPAQFWNRWPSRPPRRTRKPGRTYVEKLEVNRKLRAKMRAELGDSYLRGWMSRESGYRIKPKEWPAALVEAKRGNIKLKRL